MKTPGWASLAQWPLLPLGSRFIGWLLRRRILAHMILASTCTAVGILLSTPTGLWTDSAALEPSTVQIGDHVLHVATPTAPWLPLCSWQSALFRFGTIMMMIWTASGAVLLCYLSTELSAR